MEADEILAHYSRKLAFEWAYIVQDLKAPPPGHRWVPDTVLRPKADGNYVLELRPRIERVHGG